MKIYKKIVLDKNDNIIEEHSYDYEGPIAHAGGGSKVLKAIVVVAVVVAAVVSVSSPMVLETPQNTAPTASKASPPRTMLFDKIPLMVILSPRLLYLQRLCPHPCRHTQTLGQEAGCK